MRSKGRTPVEILSCNAFIYADSPKLNQDESDGTKSITQCVKSGIRLSEEIIQGESRGRLIEKKETTKKSLGKIWRDHCHWTWFTIAM